MKRPCLWIPLLLVLMSPLSPAQADARLPTDSLPVLQINATQRTPLETGLETGKQAKRLFPDIERRYDKHLSSLFHQAAFEIIRTEQLPVLWQNIPPRYQEEFKGIAAAWDLTGQNQLGDGRLSLDELRVLNLLADLGQAPAGSGFAVMGKVSAETGGIIGRNLDWKSSAELRSLQAITVHEYADHAIVNIGFAGLLSVLSGFNEHGLFLASFNAEPASPYPATPAQTGTLSSIGFTVRAALEDSQSLQAATRLLLKQHYAISQNILAGNHQRVQVIEYPGEGKAKVRTWKSLLHANTYWEHKRQIAVVDCNMLAELPDNCQDTGDTVRWERLQELAQFSPKHPASTTDISAILSDRNNDGYELLNARTLQSMLYLPGNSSLFLYAAPVSGQTPAQIAHKAYLELLPASLRHKPANTLISLSALIWFVLLLKVLITLWLFRGTITRFVQGKKT